MIKFAFHARILNPSPIHGIIKVNSDHNVASNSRTSEEKLLPPVQVGRYRGIDRKIFLKNNFAYFLQIFSNYQ